METKNALNITSPNNFWREAEVVSLNTKKNGMKRIFQKNDLHKDPIVSVNAVLTTPPKFSLQSPRRIKIYTFFSKYPFFNFPQNDPMDTKNAVIPTSRKVFDGRPKSSRSMYKNVKKII